MWQKLRDAVTQALSGGEHELGRDDLLRRVEEGIYALRRADSRGLDAFPAGVRVRITARDGSIDTLRAFVADERFERDVLAALQNRLVKPAQLPARRYEVVRGDADNVEILEDARVPVAVLVVEDGDRAGTRWPLENVAREWRLGRGRWHAEHPDDQRLPNDFVITDALAFVSRAAAVLRRHGGLLELESRQQGDFLVVVRRDGATLRPSRTASGRIVVAPGDRLELHDGRDGRLVLTLAPAEADDADPA